MNNTITTLQELHNFVKYRIRARKLDMAQDEADVDAHLYRAGVDWKPLKTRISEYAGGQCALHVVLCLVVHWHEGALQLSRQYYGVRGLGSVTKAQVLRGIRELQREYPGL